MNKPLSLRLAAASLFAALGATSAFGAGNTDTTNLNLTVLAEASIVVNTTNTPLASVGTLFADYTGTTNFTYKIRTTKSGGTGAVTLKVTSDFSPNGGPSVANPPTVTDALTYTCTVASPATSCSGSQTASALTDTGVATFGPDNHSIKAGNAGSTSWTLSNDPLYQTGTYTAIVTYTISAT